METLAIGDLAARSGVAPSALRYYEREGLIRSTRTAGNQRRYLRSELPEERTPTKADWARLSAHWRGKLEERILLMQRLRDQLTGCIGCGCLSLQRCNLINPGDRLAARGTGPQMIVNPPQ